MFQDGDRLVEIGGGVMQGQVHDAVVDAQKRGEDFWLTESYFRAMSAIPSGKMGGYDYPSHFSPCAG
jgi:hypothetical protein